MSTARDELVRICVGENANMEEYRNDFNKVHQVIRYSQRYAEALGAAQKLVREAEAFT